MSTSFDCERCLGSSNDFELKFVLVAVIFGKGRGRTILPTSSAVPGVTEQADAWLTARDQCAVSWIYWSDTIRQTVSLMNIQVMKYTHKAMRRSRLMKRSL